MARRAVDRVSEPAMDDNNGLTLAVEEILGRSTDLASCDELLAELARLRARAGNEKCIDRQMLCRMAHMRKALAEVQEEQDQLRRLIDTLTAPPYFPAVFLCSAGAPVDGALVQLGNEHRVVQVNDGIPALAPGDEVFLSQERNVIVAKTETPVSATGEVAAYSRNLSDGRMVLRSRDEELVVFSGPKLHDQILKTGDSVRFLRAAGLALERIESQQGQEYFLEETPVESFDQVGGLDREIDELKKLMTLHLFHADVANRYRLPRRRSVLMTGPPGNGKTLLARATCAWMASVARSGRSRFIHVKPNALNSMWYGATEQRYRDIFRVAREAAIAESDVPVVMFWDEVDSVGASRGATLHRIDDKMLNSFMAELDGLEARGNIVVMAATNRLDALDPALLRPGRLGDLVLHIPRPKSRAARAILSRHLPTDIPYAANGEGPASAREALLDLAVGQLFAQNSETELAHIMLRDGKQRGVRAGDLVSGAHLQAMAQCALERACVREVEGGPAGVCAHDISAAVAKFLASAPAALTPQNARSYLPDLPQDVDVVRVDRVEHKLSEPHRYRVEAA